MSFVWFPQVEACQLNRDSPYGGLNMKEVCRRVKRLPKEDRVAIRKRYGFRCGAILYKFPLIGNLIGLFNLFIGGIFEGIYLMFYTCGILTSERMVTVASLSKYYRKLYAHCILCPLTYFCGCIFKDETKIASYRLASKYIYRIYGPFWVTEEKSMEDLEFDKKIAEKIMYFDTKSPTSP